MKPIAKTKIIRCRGCEIYFRKFDFPEGNQWEPMRKDTSAIVKLREEKFEATGYVVKIPSECSEAKEAFRPIPANFDTDTLSPYKANEYAEGHAPLRAFSFR